MGLRQDLGRPLGTVLLVDDIVMLRKGVRILLEDAGFEVYEADSGPEALALLKAHGVDLVVTDLSMPEMTGIEWLRLANLPKDGKPFVLMMSAKATPKDIEEAKEVGVRDVLPKPYRKDALISRIDQLLGINRVMAIREAEEKKRAAKTRQKEVLRKKEEDERKKEEEKREAKKPEGEKH